MAHVLGIDIGGSGMKAAPVDTATGQFLADRQKLMTPQPATPEALAKVVEQLVRSFNWTGLAGITFPGVVVDGVIWTAANLDPSWLGVDAGKLFGSETNLTVTVLNDADAAGVAEIHFGAGKGVSGTVLLVTLGTGIGSALFIDGVLVPNTEFGHIEIHGKDAEKHASDHAREEHDLSWSDWARRVDEYLERMEALLSPGLIIIGGGVSRKSSKFLPLLAARAHAKIVPAALQNDAGIVGAAMAVEAAHGRTAPQA
jgi:polyphosphate glucokinase